MTALERLLELKRAGRKIVGVVAWDYQIAQIVERVGVDLVSVGDSVGVNLWGQREHEISLEEMLTVCRAVRRGVQRTLVSCDLPPRFIGVESARRLLDAGADMVKVAADAQTTARICAAGIPVFAEFHGGIPVRQCVEQAQALEAAGAKLLDFRHSGPEAGAAVVRAVSIPVLGGLGGGPWLDGRLRMAHAAIGYGAAQLDTEADAYANVARTARDALAAYADDVRAGRHLKGQRPA